MEGFHRDSDIYWREICPFANTLTTVLKVYTYMANCYIAFKCDTYNYY